MRGLRLKFMLFLYNWSSRLYAELFKGYKAAWGIKKEEFLEYQEGSLGYALGMFYKEKGFDVMPKLENHDVFHLITETGTEISDEIAMQYLLFGNGKLSLYLLAMIFIGTFVFPEHSAHYWSSYRKGKAMHKFHHIEFKTFLNESLSTLQLSLDKKQLKLQVNPIQHGK
ncbi:Uncharacterised protein [Sphingobacterium mizutaii]|uniref:Coenzyme Q (Ubiquinone) biosynthesis protein Coq4 n=2 Tax=Sphingobacterium mizutaii TaxID=1010 RepID=A0AAJ5C1H0_9SPHI|nr:Coq4 family protein [Sphingobacterium mizutaii]SDL31912.1 Coenzyme Q (ubiquinone) biosynthesis protein Coq4 [Sphingobacterium mizutaii]SNV54837.1 Uncharacterised protein [Sphingobacterium mizutaii]